VREQERVVSSPIAVFSFFPFSISPTKLCGRLLLLFFFSSQSGKNN